MTKRISLLLVSTGIIFATAFGATSAKWAVTDNADAFGVRVGLSIPTETHTVKFYKTFTNGEWGGEEELTVNHGDTFVAPTVSLADYTMKGWKNIAPTLSTYSPDYDTDAINEITVESDLTFYPVLESNNNRVYIQNLGYVGDADKDITLDVSSIAGTYIGKEYIGVTNGVCNPIADWKEGRSLYSSSGIYKFTNKDGGAFCSRKITISITNVTWWADANAITKVHAWDASGTGYDYEIAASSFSATSHTATIYINATCENLMVMRINPNNKSQIWNQTVDAKITKTGVKSEKYSKDHATFYIESSGGDTSKDYSWY